MRLGISLAAFALAAVVTAASAACSSTMAIPAPQSMTVDYIIGGDVLGIPPDDVVFAWVAAASQFPAGCRGLTQAAYRIVVVNALTNATVWDTGAVASNETSMIPYAGSELVEDYIYGCVQLHCFTTYL